MNRFFAPVSALFLLGTVAAWPVQAAPLIKPSSAWLVGPSAVRTVATQGVDKGCSMVAEYENGRLIGFHARQNGLFGMTVDTRSQSFVKGQAYTTSFKLADKKYALGARASDPATLSLDLKPAGTADLGTRLARNGKFELMVQGEKLPAAYATTGLNDGLARLQTCLDEQFDVAPQLVMPVKTIRTTTDNFEDADFANSNRLVQTKTVKAAPITPISEEALDAPYDDEIASLIPDVSPIGSHKPLPLTPQPKAAVAPKVPAQQSVEASPAKPLVMALADILPTGSKYTITGLNPMTEISWQASDNWRTALSQALAEKNASFTEKGGRIFITPLKTAENTGSPITSPEPATGKKVVDALPKPTLPEALPPMPKLASSASTPDPVVPAAPVWQAKKGEKLSEVLANWSTQAGMPARIDVSPSLTLAADFEHTGSFETAVSNVLKPFNKGKNAPQAHFTKMAQPVAVAPATASAQPVALTPAPQVWRGAEGAPLQDVLMAWGNAAGVDVVWDSNAMFDLRHSARYSGSFEEAVSKVMAQYEGDDIKPTAILNTDPETGKKALVIQSSGV